VAPEFDRFPAFFSPAHPVMCAVLRHVFLIMSEDKLHGGCSGKTEKKNRDEAIMWLDFRPWTVSKKKKLRW